MSDRLPICEMCRNFPGEYNFCPITGRCCRDDYLYESCSDFEQKALPTLFHRITSSPEVLAEKFVYCENEEHIFSCASWRSTLLGNTSYARKGEAIAATVEKLKEIDNA